MRKIFSILLCLCLLLALPLTVSAEDVQYDASILIDDSANLLTESQQAMLSDMIVSCDFPLSVVIATTDSLGTSTPEEFANDRYDQLCNSENGILLLVAMQSRDWYILTVGEVRNRISDEHCQDIADCILPDLSDGRYYAAFDTFLFNLPADLDNSRASIPLLIPLIIGIVVGGIVILIMRSRMNTAKPQRSAMGYVEDGSFMLNQNLDFYLYSHVTKIPRPQNSSSSSGGSSRGGSGGKF